MNRCIEMASSKRAKKQNAEEGIFSIYPDFPVLINDKVIIDSKDRPLHFHYYLEIGYCMEGKAVFTSNNREFEVNKNDITIVESNVLHKNRGLTDEVHWAYIYVDFNDLIKLFPAGDAKTRMVFMKESLKDILCIEGEKHPDMLWIISEILRLYSEKKQSYKMQIIDLVHILLLKIYDTFAVAVSEETQYENLPIMPAIEYIYEHYMEQVKVTDLARACHFSESYFRKVFVEMKGMAPLDYLHSIRIREACRMLLNSTDTVRVIGEKCGYTSATTFERNFRQRTGMLPSEWRVSKKYPSKKDRNGQEIARIFV